MLQAWSVREKVLAAVIAVLVFLLLAGPRTDMILTAEAQADANVQDLLNVGPAGVPHTIWGDGHGNVYVSDGLGVFRSTQQGAPGTWHCVLR